MYFEINPSLAEPIHLQIVHQVQCAIASGALAPGERLPSTRDLSVKLRVNPNTVARAYGDLERAGFLETRRGEGIFVSASPPAVEGKQARKLVMRQMEQAVRDGVLLGMGDLEMRDVLEEALDRVRRQGLHADSRSR
ncbi:MAG: GntR family transcriptional regulator [Candidatus Wallbacteria bacterium]|nr:GntR family transcriptional regulator [Candidatus Wallbacteria bacterium]